MKHYVIYIPGLGGNKYLVQGIFVWIWRLYGVKAATRTMNWSDDESFEAKLTRLLAEVDEHLAKGHKVSLVGASAGASAVINAFAARPQIHGVVIICGKVQHPETVSDQTYRRNPTFKESMALLPESLGKLGRGDRARILNLHPVSDPSVPVADTKVEGSHERTMAISGHTAGILTALSFYGHSICKFLKQQY